MSYLDDNGPNTPETLCDRARRIAHEAQCAALAKQANEQHAFLKTILGEHGLDDIDYDEKTKTYLICGWRWSLYRSMGEWYLWLAQLPANLVRRQRMDCGPVTSLEDLGVALIKLDKASAALRAKYPDTRWGDFHAWWDSWSFGFLFFN